LVLVGLLFPVPDATRTALASSWVECPGPYQLNGRVQGDRYTLRWEGDDCEGWVEVLGQVDLNARGGIVRLAPGARISGHEEIDGLERHIRVLPGQPGKIAVDHRVDGERTAFDARARTWLAEALLLLQRQTGYGAQARVVGILTREGVTGLVSELRRIDNDRVETVYVMAGLQAEAVDAEGRAELVRAASRSIPSDGDLADVLEKAAQVARPGDGVLAAVAEASAAVASDADCRRVLATALVAGATPNEQALLLTASSSIRSDRDLAVLLADATPDLDLGRREVRQAYARTASGIGSDADLVHALAAVARHGALPDPALAMLLEVSAEIGSEGDLLRLLRIIAEHQELRGETLQAYTSAAGRLAAEPARRRALEAL